MLKLGTHTNAMLLVTSIVLATPAYALDGGDATKGEGVFKKCQSCHQIGEGAENKVGPMLNDLIGRTAGTVEDFKYGKSIVKAGEAGLVWTEEEIFAYLKDPKKYLRKKLDDKKAKSKMSFKLKKEDERQNVIAYLKTFSAAEEATDGAAEETSEEATTSSD